MEAFAMDTNQQDEGEARPGDLLVSADPIRAFLVSLGMPAKTDPYYLKKSGWPIGNTAGDAGKLIASKRRLARHVEKLVCGRTAAA
jgi:hypothetical protein